VGYSGRVSIARRQPSPQTELLEVRTSLRYGLGVFSRAVLQPGDVIEQCPVLLVEPGEADSVSSGSLSGYVYDWGDGHVAIALGYGSLYNHDPEPNAEYAQSDDGTALVVTALAPIAPGEEITIDYTGGDPSSLWFTLRPTGG
jgi:uncharacterized protein